MIDQVDHLTMLTSIKFSNEKVFYKMKLILSKKSQCILHYKNSVCTVLSILFLKRLKESFYLLLVCYELSHCQETLWCS